MDKEFHYYITYLVALRAGFSSTNSYLLAYSSQYVDDNDIIFEINIGSPNYYSNYISQTINILKPKNRLFRIYPLFHFIPGEPLEDNARRKDGKLHTLNTTPDSNNARKILELAFNSRNIYRIGIASHAFVDTWAHQNFTGYYDEFNAMKNLLQKPLPRIGHAGAGHKPDRPAITWEDCRLVNSLEIRNNKDLFLKAAGRLFEELRLYVKPECRKDLITEDRDELVRDISEAIGEADQINKYRDARIERYKKIALSNEYGRIKLKEYDPDDWMDEAVNENIKGFRMRGKKAVFRFIKSSISNTITSFKDVYSWKKPGKYEETNWYKFQEAVKAHQKEAEALLFMSTFNKLELKNW
ncbi:DUF6765 family protein [Desulfitibacter alkalitolerans]|uniref:DUF6765 family protein n=1 Tax=Desulfitibacter alkalitolerans TaxID=264641 RepID=UPI0006870A76|nr:DUF6765 family protein [Desulfitibacter alkalitolerans]